MAVRRRNLLLVILSLVGAVGMVANVTSLFMPCGQFMALVSSPAQAKNVEYVSQSHPWFEQFTYEWLKASVLSVKLSNNATDKYVLVPASQLRPIFLGIEEREIPVVFIDHW